MLFPLGQAELYAVLMNFPFSNHGQNSGGRHLMTGGEGYLLKNMFFETHSFCRFLKHAFR